MADLLAKANDFIFNKRREFLVEEVEYIRQGDSVGFLCPCTIGRSYFSNGNRYFAVSDVNGVTNRIRSIDFIIDVENFIGGEPMQGDRIKRSNGQICEVFPPMNESCWKWSGSAHTTYRIHTYDVSETEE